MLRRPTLPSALCLISLTTAAWSGQFSLLAKVGLTDRDPTEWRGRVQVVGGSADSVRGWLLSDNEQVAEDGSFRFSTDAVPQTDPPRVEANGIIVDGEGGDATLLKLTANAITWDVPLGRLTAGVPLVHETGALSVQLAPRYTTLSADEGEADYPAVCRLGSGDPVAVWQVYAAQRDTLQWAVLRDGAWSDPEPVGGFGGDLYQPTCAPDGESGFWTVCSRQDNGDFDLYALHWDGAKWADPVNISGTPGNDFNQSVCTDERGVVYCVWQAFRGESSDILMARCVDGRWERPRVVASSPANEWSPAISSGKAGVWAAWDTYQNGSYDIYATRIVDGRPEQPRPVAASPRFEAKASVACDGRGAVWIAWQDAGENWAKDTGYTVPAAQRTQPIYAERSIKVACIQNDQLLTAPDAALAMPEDERRFLEEPRLCCDESDRVWLVFLHPTVRRALRGNRLWAEKAWERYATHLDGSAWAPALHFPDRLSRIDTIPALVPVPGGIGVVFHTDGRTPQQARLMTRNRVYATTLQAPAEPAPPQLVPTSWPEPAPVRLDEAQHVRRAREYEVSIGDGQLRLLRGDTHRHTEISWDGNGDGSVLDAYRYALDAAGLDFFMVSDHNQQTGVDLEYIWWRSYKLADVHNNPPAFNTLFGYERSCGYPNGHRNVINADRNHPSFRMTGQPDDLKQLYEYCRRERAIMIAHTTGSNHGTNWQWYDQAFEPVIEIFQGCRTSFEYEGAPKSATPGDGQADRTGYQPQGFLWRAWQRDLRLGIISSSDHGSTHYSYAAVYCPEPSRNGVIEGLKSRRTFGATDNLIVDMRSPGHFMGDEWTQEQPPVLEVKVLGTAPITQLEVIRDFEFVHTLRPNTPTAEFTWMDNDFTPGTHLYYVRAIQADESVAWGSPVWITKG